MRKLLPYFLITLAVVLWHCDRSDFSLSPSPAGKHIVEQDSVRYVIRWLCHDDTLTWTAIYADTVTFSINGEKRLVRIRQPALNRSRIYRDSAVVFTADTLGRCTISSPLIRDSTLVRLYQDEVWVDRYFRYYVKQAGESYLVSRRYAHSHESIYPLTPPPHIIWYRDFADLWNRDDPRPEGLVEIRKRRHHVYYAPFNFSADALDTLQVIPKDDRPFLLSAMERDTILVSIKAPHHPVRGIEVEDPPDDPIFSLPETSNGEPQDSQPQDSQPQEDPPQGNQPTTSPDPVPSQSGGWHSHLDGCPDHYHDYYIDAEHGCPQYTTEDPCGEKHLPRQSPCP